MKEKIEYYMVKPNLKQIFGKKVTKDMKFDEYTEDKSVHQTLKNLVLTTEIKRESEYLGIKSNEESKLTQTLKEGTVLLWSEEVGYIIPQCQICTLEELSEEMKQVENIYKGEINNDSKGNEKNNI